MRERNTSGVCVCECSKYRCELASAAAVCLWACTQGRSHVSHVFPCSYEAWRVSFVMLVLLCMSAHWCDPFYSLQVRVQKHHSAVSQYRDTTVAVSKLMKTTTNATSFLPSNISVFLAGVNNYMWYNRITAAELHLRILINFRRPFICYEEGESHDNNCTE